jgi:hypothetical protein
MDKAFKDALAASRKISDLVKASELTPLQQAIDEITEPSRRIKELLGPVVFEEMRLMEEARQAMQPAVLAMEAYRNDLSIANQAMALRLPELSITRQANFASIQELASVSAAMAEMFRPTATALHAMSLQIAEIIEPSRHLFVNASWAGDLERRMGLINADWAIADRLAISGLSFGELAWFSDTVRFDAPYSEEVNEAVVEELGKIVHDPSEDTDEREAQYDAAGRKPALVAFPEDSYPSVVVASGFELVFPLAPVPKPIGNVTASLNVSSAPYIAMREIENHLRKLIADRLSTVERQWEKRLVPGDMRQRWIERREEYRAQGQPVFPLIYYSDLGDLGQIIVQNNNWPLFEPIFRQRDSLLVSISRLTPVRNTVMHGRPLSQSEVLYIAAEGHRLLSAMGLITIQ